MTSLIEGLSEPGGVPEVEHTEPVPSDRFLGIISFSNINKDLKPNSACWLEEDPSERPAKPEPRAAYPSKLDLLLELLREFQGYHPDLVVKAILADALYGSAVWMNRAAVLFPQTQVISQLKQTQNVRFRQREMTVTQYFATHPGIATTLRIRGGPAVTVILGGARLYVSAHQQKRFVVALKYPGEEDYRYLVANDMSWRAVDIASAHTLRVCPKTALSKSKSYLCGSPLAGDLADHLRQAGSNNQQVSF